MDFLEKLDFLMDKFGLTKTSLSKKSDIPYTTIDAWYKKGYEGLKLTTLRKLAQYFNTTLDYWFLDEVTDPNYGKTSGFKVEYNEMEHIKKYRFISSHSPDAASVVDLVLNREYAIVQQMQGKEKRIKELEKELIPKRILAYYGKIAAAGTSVEFSDMIAGTQEYLLTSESERADYTIGVNGDSMEPTYSDGDIVYVKKETHLTTGDIGIFQKHNGIYIKEVGENVLLSHNPKYKPIKNDGDIICLGKVLGKVEE